MACPRPLTSASELGSPTHICTLTALTPPTSALGLWAVCAGIVHRLQLTDEEMIEAAIAASLGGDSILPSMDDVLAPRQVALMDVRESLQVTARLHAMLGMSEQQVSAHCMQDASPLSQELTVPLLRGEGNSQSLGSEASDAAETIDEIHSIFLDIDRDSIAMILKEQQGSHAPRLRVPQLHAPSVTR